MSQTKIIELLKKNPSGLTAQELHNLLGTTNCYGQLKKLEKYKEVVMIDNPHSRKKRWVIA